MAVYVDPLFSYPASPKWRHGDSCHLFADTLGELHSFASSIGLKKQWFQNKSFPHYDLNINKRIEALRQGAKELSFTQTIQKIIAVRKNRKSTVIYKKVE